jgi:hypothetical protein
VAEALIQIRWRSPSGAASEHCALRDTDGGVTLEGVALAADPMAPALRYRIVADAAFAGLRSAHLTVVGGPTLALRHDGYGGWTDGEGKTRKDLAGVLDLWLDQSPVPLLVLLRRLGGKPGKSVKLDVARADPAAVTVTRASLEVTCRTPTTWTVTIAGGDAEAVTFDADNLLATWGNRFARVVAVPA